MVIYTVVDLSVVGLVVAFGSVGAAVVGQTTLAEGATAGQASASNVKVFVVDLPGVAFWQVSAKRSTPSMTAAWMHPTKEVSWNLSVE